MAEQTQSNTQLRDEPVGSGDWVVKQGECVTSIAEQSGHFREHLWGLAANAELKSVRKDPNALLPDDRLHVPPIEPKHEEGETDQHHRFRRKGVPSMLRVRCLVYDEPLSNLPYTLTVDGRDFTGQTDGDGRVAHAIPADAKEGLLVIRKGEEAYEYEFDLGALDPIDTTTGVKARLQSLGFDPGPIDAQDTGEYRAALREFQKHYELQITGEPDPGTRDKLEEFAR